MNVAVFAWVTVATVLLFLGVQRVSEQPLEPTVLDLVFCLSVALVVSLLFPV